MPGSILSYCSCRAADGKQYPQGKCPRWGQRGHRKWGFALALDRRWDEATGRWKRQQARRMGYLTRRDAEQALAAEVPAAAAGTAPSLAVRQTTLGEFLDHWLRDPRWRPTIRNAYQRDTRLYLKPGLGRLRLTDLRPEHIAGLLDRMRDGRLRPPGRGGATPPAAVWSAYTTLRAALNQGTANAAWSGTLHGCLSGNPTPRTGAGMGTGARRPDSWTMPARPHPT